MLAPFLIFAALSAFAKVNFVREVKPILELHCVRCHGEDRAFKSLRLDRRDRAMQAIVARKPDESVLYLAIKTGFMPLGADKVAPGELETLRRWIAEGARWPKKVQLEPKNPFTAQPKTAGMPPRTTPPHSPASPAPPVSASSDK
jgi:hypothetical protein